MPLDVNKYIQHKKKNIIKRKLKYFKLKIQRNQKQSSIFMQALNFGIVLLLFLFLMRLWSLYEINISYSIAMPSIAGYFIKNNDYVTASGIYSISRKEKDKGKQSASLLFGEVKCDYKTARCIEELVSIIRLGEVYIIPHHNEYDITYRNKDKILFGDGYKTSGIVDLNQETITKTIHKTFPTEKIQTDEFITDDIEILKEEKRIIRKYLKHKIFGKF